MINKVYNFIRARFRKHINQELWLEDHIKAGLKVGKNCQIQPGLIIDHSHCWLIEIEDNVTIAPYVYILAHDASTKKHLNYSKIGNVTIKKNSFIGARSIILPGVTIGENAIVAAGSVISKDVETSTVVGGNPAKFIMTTEEYIQKHKVKMTNARIYGEEWLIHNGITNTMKMQMKNELKNQEGYVI